VPLSTLLIYFAAWNNTGSLCTEETFGAIRVLQAFRYNALEVLAKHPISTILITVADPLTSSWKEVQQVVPSTGVTIHIDEVEEPSLYLQFDEGASSKRTAVIITDHLTLRISAVL